MKNVITSIKTWWNNHRTCIIAGFKRCCKAAAAIGKKSGKILFRITKICSRILLIGILLNLLVPKFYPEFAERFPTLYEFYSGCVQFGEFVLKSGLLGLDALFEGSWSEFRSEFGTACQELWQQFQNWINTLQF